MILIAILFAVLALGITATLLLLHTLAKGFEETQKEGFEHPFH